MRISITEFLFLFHRRQVIPSFGACSWWINSSSKCFHILFSGVQISSDVLSEPPSKSPQGFSLIVFILHFYLIILLSPEFFMVVLHDLIHSSRVHQDFCSRVLRVLFLHVSDGVLSKFFRAYSFLPCLTGVVSESIWFRELLILVILLVPLFFSSALDSLLLLLSSCFTSSLFPSVSVLRSRDEISC